MINHPEKKYPTLGCCGLDCGLCPRYYTEGDSRCPGCCGSDFFNKHPGCGHITCCVKKHNLEVCTLCDDFPCDKFKSWFGNEAYDSFLTHRKVESNLYFIKKHGLEAFIKQQKERIKILKELLDEFNDNRSKSYYCIATTLLPIEDIKKSVDNAKRDIKNLNIKKDDYKTKAKILKKNIQEIADKKNIDLKLRKTKK